MVLFSKIEGSGKPLLILHGFLGMSDNWKSLGSEFANLGYQVHLIDLRNHGRSFHDQNFSYELMAKDILEYCNYHNIDKFSILGHSMGGKVAMLFATQNPEKVENLIVADIAPKYYPPHHQDILEGLKAVDFTTKPSRAEVDGIISEHIPDFGTRQFLLKNLYWQSPDQLNFRFNLKYLVANIEQIGQALPIDLIYDGPTYFIRGGNSNYILDTDFVNIKTHFPQAQIDTIPDVGHWLHAENPKVFFELVKIFWFPN